MSTRPDWMEFTGYDFPEDIDTQRNIECYMSDCKRSPDTYNMICRAWMVRMVPQGQLNRMFALAVFLIVEDALGEYRDG